MKKLGHDNNYHHAYSLVIAAHNALCAAIALILQIDDTELENERRQCTQIATKAQGEMYHAMQELRKIENPEATQIDPNTTHHKNPGT